MTVANTLDVIHKARRNHRRVELVIMLGGLVTWGVLTSIAAYVILEYLVSDRIGLILLITLGTALFVMTQGTVVPRLQNAATAHYNGTVDSEDIQQWMLDVVGLHGQADLEGLTWVFTEREGEGPYSYGRRVEISNAFDTFSVYVKGRRELRNATKDKFIRFILGEYN